MKRLTVLLPILVFGALLAAFAAERLGGPGTALPSFTPAQPPRFGSLAPPGGRAALGGRVVDPAGAPVEDASVYLRSGGAPFWTFTDADGRFELQGLAPEPADAVVLAWGFPPASFEVTPGPEAVALALPPRNRPPPEPPDLARADLEGKVRGTGAAWGDPEGYEIVLTPTRPPDELQGPVERRVRTDASGAFRVADLALGSYRIAVLPAWARGGTWPSLAAAWSAELDHAGPDRPLEVELAAGAVEGRLWNPSRQPVEGALVLIADATDPRRVWPPAATDADGRFLVRALPEGRYALSARAGEGVLEMAVAVRAGEVARPDLPALHVRTD